MSEGIAPGIDRKRRLGLVHAPTPLEPLKGLTRQLAGPEIWVKRDDCTGLALGGNKARKLEFLMAEARASGADTVVTIGACQSNHVRMTAAAARVSGLESVSILFGGGEPAIVGNRLLDELLGTEIVELGFPFAEATPQRIEAEADKTMERLRSSGRQPFFIAAGGATPLGALGYFRATEELAGQARRGGCVPDALVVPVGTGGTLAGVLLGVDALRLGWRVHGFSVAPEGAWQRAGVAACEEIAQGAAGMLGQEFRLSQEAYEITYDQVGKAYGDLTPACAEAIRMVARSDGILLDPVYTGKAMAGLISLVRQGRLVKGQTVVFLHTGGAPALFAYPQLANPG